MSEEKFLQRALQPGWFLDFTFPKRQTAPAHRLELERRFLIPRAIALYLGDPIGRVGFGNASPALA